MENFRFVLGLPRWMRGNARVIGEHVVLDSNSVVEYEFDGSEASRKMAFDLARLPWPDHTDMDAFAGRVEEFVRNHGLLWHGARDKNTGLLKEPLSAWYDHAVTLWYLGSLYQAIHESKRQWSEKPVQSVLRKFGFGIPGVSTRDPDFVDKYIEAATSWLANRLNAGMQGRSDGRYQWGVSVQGPGDLHLAQCPTDLQSHAYATFAVLMVSKVPMKTCPGCGRLFSPRDIRQKWHTPGCGSTRRGRARRARLRES